MKKSKVYCIDGFYETNYTSRSVTEIKELYKKFDKDDVDSVFK